VPANVLKGSRPPQLRLAVAVAFGLALARVERQSLLAVVVQFFQGIGDAPFVARWR
jgi:hypothetical protein